jgi:hypothetical protein
MTAEAIFMTVKSAGFGGRNVDKTVEGDVGRLPVFFGQGYRAIDEARKIDGVIGRSAQTATSVFQDIAKQEKCVEYVGKAAKWASNWVNPLICVSSGIDVALSDNKEETFVVNSTALATMFAGEKVMKDHLDDVVKVKGVKTVAETVTKFTSKFKYGKAVSPIVKGLAFIVGSCGFYGGGERIGKVLVDKSKQTEAYASASPKETQEVKQAVQEQPEAEVA